MNLLLTICARGGSKGIPGKNIKLLNGKPLIYYSLVLAKKFSDLKGNTAIVLSTDSEEIKDVVVGLNIGNIDVNYTRPEFLASDTAGKLDVIKDVKKYAEQKNNIKYDFVIDLDVTSPFRTIEDLQEALAVLNDHNEALNIFSVNKANRNPYFNMVEETKDGFYKLCKEGSFLTRQSAPKVYDMNASFYIYRSSFFDNEIKGVITNKTLIYDVPHLCFDLDHPIDFEFMSYLLMNDKVDFEFLK